MGSRFKSPQRQIYFKSVLSCTSHMCSVNPCVNGSDMTLGLLLNPSYASIQPAICKLICKVDLGLLIRRLKGARRGVGSTFHMLAWVDLPFLSSLGYGTFNLLINLNLMDNSRTAFGLKGECLMFPKIWINKWLHAFINKKPIASGFHLM